MSKAMENGHQQATAWAPEITTAGSTVAYETTGTPGKANKSRDTSNSRSHKNSWASRNTNSSNKIGDSESRGNRNITGSNIDY
jgi:hypothetical protein